MKSIFEFNNLRFSPEMFCHISVIKDDCCIVGLCIGKNLAIRYVSRYRVCDTIYCDTVSKVIYWDISYFRNRIYF